MPIVASVLVVVVAMGCAVWSPLNEQMFDVSGIGDYSMGPAPTALSQFGDDIWVMELGGFGCTLYSLVTEVHFDEAGEDVMDGPAFEVGRGGFPFRCLRWTVPFEADSTSTAFSNWIQGIRVTQPASSRWTRRIPLMPEPVGMVLNILIVSFAIVLVRMGLRRGVVYRRKCKSLCVHCAYPVGDFPVCPECGKPTEREA